jgi:hypothetical protein
MGSRKGPSVGCFFTCSRPFGRKEKNSEECIQMLWNIWDLIEEFSEECIYMSCRFRAKDDISQYGLATKECNFSKVFSRCNL